ncbi:MAG: aminoacyl-tRNA hydrolase [Hyphomicrobiaceae bacterium]
MKLLVGLGNPGAKYARNRHNVGFMALEAIHARHGFAGWRKRFQGEAADGEIAGEKCLLLKPLTYMNESGRAVGEAVRFLKIDVADVVVLHDELDLVPGKVKVKTGGGNAGHNGLRSISAHIGNEYQRVRIGIGHPGARELVHHYVLNDFAKAEAVWLDPLLDAMAASAPHLARGDASRFVSQILNLTGEEPERDEGGKAGKSPGGKSEKGGAKKEARDKAGKAGEGIAAKDATDEAASERPPSQRELAKKAADATEARQKGAIADGLRRWLASRK